MIKRLLTLCFQDEKDQIITTNCWLNQVHLLLLVSVLQQSVAFVVLSAPQVYAHAPLSRNF